MVSTSFQEVRLFLACRFVISVQLRQRPDHAGENAALFLQLGPPSTLILHDNGASQKRSSNGKRRNFAFAWTGNTLETEVFENDDVTTIT